MLSAHNLPHLLLPRNVTFSEHGKHRQTRDLKFGNARHCLIVIVWDCLIEGLYSFFPHNGHSCLLTECLSEFDVKLLLS